MNPDHMPTILVLSAFVLLIVWWIFCNLYFTKKPLPPITNIDSILKIEPDKPEAFSPWYSIHKVPGQIGVYQTRFYGPHGGVTYGFSWWDGSAWHSQSSTVWEACEYRAYVGGTQDKEWRGLAEEPLP